MQVESDGKLMDQAIVGEDMDTGCSIEALVFASVTATAMRLH